LGTLINSQNGGESWTQVESFTIESLNSIYFVDGEKGWSCGNKATILHTDNGGAVGIYSPSQHVIIQQEVKAYPNPCSNRLTLEFELKTHCNVNICIYDRVGRTTSTTYSETYYPGNCTVVLNQLSLPTGLYFATIHFDNHIEVIKFNVIK